MDHEPHDHDRGLEFDLTTLMQRRGALKMLAGAGVGLGLVALGACGSSDDSSSTGSTSTTSGSSSTTDPSSSSTTTSGSGSTTVSDIPEETAGPYPGDGSNGPNVLTESGIVRRDITSSFGSSSGTAEGAPLTISMKIVDASTGSAKAGAAVYVWHCTREGGYSLYSQGVTDQNFLRGVQETAGDGTVTFTSIFPAAYSGRWPHIHFEVYDSLDTATAAGTMLATSQIALPKDICDEVYATSGYEQSVQNLAQTSLTSDMVFGDDGGIHQLATMSGSVDDGLTAQLTVGV
jgi:protocatechuate 3,4-dioxygenase beta subunit